MINFWATWCVPCVKELPYFEKLNQKYKNEKIQNDFGKFRFS
ncbi:TlpA disulfide reductase family protein [Flavobacterium piscinae]